VKAALYPALLLAVLALFQPMALAQRIDTRIDEGWRTAFGEQATAQETAFDDTAWKPISIPHNWEDYQGYRQKSHGNLHGTAWYRRSFELSPAQRGQQVFLEFEGVGSYAKVWVNDKPAGEHQGSRTCFTLNITDKVGFGTTNTIAVRADHPEKIQDLPYVCGGCWGSPNTEGSQPLGIFRPVHLVITGPVRVEPFGVHLWTPQISEQQAVLSIETELKNYGASPQKVTVRNELLSASGKLIARVETSTNLESLRSAADQPTLPLRQTIPAIKTPHLWSLEDPYLHQVRTTLLLDGQAVDCVTNRFGFRWIEWPVGSVGGNTIGRPVEPAKLLELPDPTNNFFTTRTGGLDKHQTRVQPGGVRVFIPTCTAESATVRIQTTVHNGDSQPHRVRLTSFIRNEAGTKFVYSMETDRNLAPNETCTFDQTSPTIHFPELWTPEAPVLHVVETTLQDPEFAGKKNSVVYDRTDTSFGICATTNLANKAIPFVARTTSATETTNASKVFRLNGRPVFINGTAEYEHLLGNDHAFTDEQIRARMLQIKAAGFNAFREAHHPHNLRYLEWCDRLGILCWPQLGAHIYFDNEPFRQNYRLAVRDWVKEYRNSPSVVLWGLQNESRLPRIFARELTETIRQLDPTTSSQRKTTTCNGGSGSDWEVPQNWFGTYGGNVNNYGPAIVRQQLVGEYGQYRTQGLHQDGNWSTNWAAKQNLGNSLPEELFDYCLETKIRLAEDNRNQCCGQFQWIFSTHANPGRSETGCRDGLGLDGVAVVNNKGLLTSWGEPCDAFYLYRANYAPASKEPMVYLVSHTWPDRFDGPGIKSNLVAFSNCEEVELFNDYRDKASSLGVRKRGPIGTHLQWDNLPLRYNVLYAEGRVKGRVVAHDLVLLNHLPPAPAWQKHKSREPDILAAVPGAKYPYRISCGGGDYTDSNGNIWEADAHWSSWAQAYDNLDPKYASQRQSSEPIAGTRDDALFQSYRYGRQKLSYHLEVPNGNYVVELYFIEPWFGAGGGMDCTGWRLFDVALNGQVRLRNLDIWKEAGYCGVLKKALPITVNNGVIDLTFPRVASYQAVISAIAVRAQEQ
jgi:beta-galactosidase/beta-glucuronidase